MTKSEFKKNIKKVSHITFIHPDDSLNGVVLKVHYKSGYTRYYKNNIPLWAVMYADYAEVTVGFETPGHRHIDVYFTECQYYESLPF